MLFRLPMLMPIFGVCIVLCSTSAMALSITNVTTNKQHFSPRKGEQFYVRYTLDEKANSRLLIFDERDHRVRTIELGHKSAGSYGLTWSGKSDDGRLVPDGAYYYVIEGENEAGDRAAYDLTDMTLPQTEVIHQNRWDPITGRLTYVLRRPSRVSIRMGLKDGGPLLNTLINWVARDRGKHVEIWDGWDASNAINIARHPNLDISILAYPLSENAILVGSPVSRDEWMTGLTDHEKRVHKLQHKKKMVAHSQQSVAMRGDFQVSFELPGSLKKTKEGVPILAKRTPLRITVDDPGRAVMQRFEQSFFVDGKYLQETEAGYLPMTWYCDPTKLGPGIHYITTNIRSYEGNFGMGTLKILVE